MIYRKVKPCGIGQLGEKGIARSSTSCCDSWGVTCRGSEHQTCDPFAIIIVPRECQLPLSRREVIKKSELESVYNGPFKGAAYSAIRTWRGNS
jgi:hypothetical protein